MSREGADGRGAQLDRRHLTYLLALAEFGSLKAAAERLYVTPSAVATAVRQMERIVGTSLVEPRRGTMRVSPAGWDVVARARHALAALDDVAGAEGEERRRGGYIQVMATPTTAEDTVPRLAAMLSRQHGIFVQVSSAARAVVADVAGAVLDRAADAGIVERPPRPVNGLQIVPLERWEVHYAFPSGAHPTGPRVCVDELARHGLVVVPHFETSRVYRDIVRASRAIDGAVRVRSPFREHFADLALEGVAGFLCHHHQVPHLRALGLKTAPLEVGVSREIVALVRSDRRSPVITVFLEACTRYRDSIST